MTAERIAKAKSLKLAITAGIGSDHVDLQAAIDHKITVAEVTYSNSISVSEHVVMMILSLVRNYIPSYQWVIKGGWNIADCVERSYDVEGMHVGTVAAGRIGLAVLRRLKAFDMHLHYTDRHRLPEAVEEELGPAWHPNVEDMVKVCDVVTINAPLHPETENLFNDKLLAKMKRGAYLVNTARGKICDRDAIVRALESGQLAGYAGDVWFPQPAPKDHPWRTMPHHGMTPHISGTSLSAQARYAAGTREILECWFEKRPIRNEYLIVDGGKLAGAGAHSYSAGDATKGSEEAAKFGATYAGSAPTDIYGMSASRRHRPGSRAGSLRLAQPRPSGPTGRRCPNSSRSLTLAGQGGPGAFGRGPPGAQSQARGWGPAFGSTDLKKTSGDEFIQPLAALTGARQSQQQREPSANLQHDPRIRPADDGADLPAVARLRPRHHRLRSQAQTVGCGRIDGHPGQRQIGQRAGQRQHDDGRQVGEQFIGLDDERRTRLAGVAAQRDGDDVAAAHQSRDARASAAT